MISLFIKRYPLLCVQLTSPRITESYYFSGSGQMEMMAHGGQPVAVRLDGLSGRAAERHLNLMKGLLDGTKELM